MDLEKFRNDVYEMSAKLSKHLKENDVAKLGYVRQQLIERPARAAAAVGHRHHGGQVAVLVPEPGEGGLIAGPTPHNYDVLLVHQNMPADQPATKTQCWERIHSIQTVV